jgi:hypothetical protein
MAWHLTKASGGSQRGGWRIVDESGESENIWRISVSVKKASMAINGVMKISA